MDQITTELFLLSCLNHSTAGTVDFNAVGAECGLKPNAARMRLKRFKDKHAGGMNAASPATGASSPAHAAAEDDGDSEESPTAKKAAMNKSKPKKAAMKKAGAKKRKLSDDSDATTVGETMIKDEDTEA